MERRRLIIILVIIGLLLAVSAGVWWLLQRDDVVPVSTTPVTPTTVDPLPANTDVTVDQRTPVTSVADLNQSSAVRTARLFTERFATFSTTDNFAGIEQVRGLMTNSFERWFSTGYIDSLNERYPDTSVYAGETAKVIGVEVVSSDDNKADILIRAQRTRSTAENSVVTYQDLRLELLKVSDAWLVDGAYWQ